MPRGQRGRVQCRLPWCNEFASGNGLCLKHYTRELRGHPMKKACEVPGCLDDDIKVNARKCEAHRYSCTVAGCKRRTPKSWRYCSMHEQRVKKLGHPGSAEATMRAKGTGTDWKPNKDGYVERSQVIGGKRTRQLQHRVVMEEHLGRPLMPHESVHHINGVRHDNRPENLELWSTSQPSGQRVEDKIKWAREFLAQYENGDI